MNVLQEPQNSSRLRILLEGIMPLVYAAWQIKGPHLQVQTAETPCEYARLCHPESSPPNSCKRPNYTNCPSWLKVELAREGLLNTSVVTIRGGQA